MGAELVLSAILGVTKMTIDIIHERNGEVEAPYQIQSSQYDPPVMKTIRVGMTQAQVIDALGKPSRVDGPRFVYNGNICSRDISCLVKFYKGRVTNIWDVRPEYLEL